MARAHARAQGHNPCAPGCAICAAEQRSLDRIRAKAKAQRAKGPGQGWRCSGCDRPLPRRGRVWRWRLRKWQRSSRPGSGYYCDPCADRRETGGDY